MFKRMIHEAEEFNNAIEKETSIKEYTQEEILEALTLIKTICKQHSNCEACPFRRLGGGCEITHCFPSFWKFSTEPQEWRAFY